MVDYWTAPDLSCTTTTEAVKATMKHVLADVENGFPEALHCGHIFATLCMAEGYSDETARALAENPFYFDMIHRLQAVIVELSKSGMK